MLILPPRNILSTGRRGCIYVNDSTLKLYQPIRYESRKNLKKVISGDLQLALSNLAVVSHRRHNVLSPKQARTYRNLFKLVWLLII